MGTGTVARPLPAPRQRPATPPNPDSKSIDAKPPAKRQRRAPKPKPGKRSGRPKKIPPIKVGLLSLPAEIIGRIASFLLPPTINVQDGFLPPWELPYGGLRSKTPRAKIKEYRFGGIPSGVRDVLNLARTCRKCESGVGLVIGKIGDGKSDGKKRTMYIFVPQEEVTEYPIRQHFVDRSEAKKMFDRIKASSEVLERLVVHQCYHPSDRYNGFYGHDNSVISRLEPFQTTATSFPNLEYLQLGPNLCHECISAVLHLFVGKQFTRAKRYSSTGQLISESDAEEEGDDNDKAKMPRMAIWESHGQRNRPNTFNGINPTASSPRFVDFDLAAAPNLTSLQLFIPAQIKHGHDSDILKGILRLIPPSTSIRMFQVWLRENGGWRGMGASGTVNAYVCKDVKVVEEELTEWAKKEKEKSMTVQERLLAKFQADAAKVLPFKRKKEVVEIREITEEEESVDNKDDDEGTTPSEPDVKQEMSDVEAELNGGFSDSEAGHDSNDSKAPKMTTAERHAIYSHRASARGYSPILSSIAAAMPDLIGLSVLRQGTYMAEITEGARLLDSEVELWVEPLLKLESLQYLDLGLAIPGIKEVSDFPIGLSITQSRKGRETAKATGNDIQALKRRKYELDIKKAVEEGDKWRLEVLKRFLIPKSNDVPQSLADAESNAGSSTAGNGNGNGNGNEDEGSAVTWPKGLKSGYIYSTDLVNRLRGNGLAIPWKVVGKTVQLGQPKRIKL